MFKKLKTEVKNKLDDYREIWLTWFARIAVIKMKILPKINFLIMMLAIELPEEELKD